MRRTISTARCIAGCSRRALRHLWRGQWVRYSIYAGTDCEADVEAALRAEAAGHLVEGPDVEIYEAEFAKVAGCAYGISFAAGRHGLYELMAALGIGEGDEVILQAFTCVVVPNALIYRGIRPIYVDIDRSYNPDLDQLEAAITPRTKAILLQHTFGWAADCRRAREIADRHHLALVEDAAHCLGAWRDGKPVGAWGDAAYFSTDHSKVINTHTGGMVTTNDASLAKRLRARQRQLPCPSMNALRRAGAAFRHEVSWYAPNHGAWGPYLAETAFRFSDRGMYLDEHLTSKPEAFPLRLANLQAAIGRRQLADLPNNLAARKRNAEVYDVHFGLYNEVLAKQPTEHIFLLYTFLVEERDRLELELASHRSPGTWFTTVFCGRWHDMESVGYTPGSCPRAEFAAAHCLNFPTHARVTMPELLLGRLAELTPRMVEMP